MARRNGNVDEVMSGRPQNSLRGDVMAPALSAEINRLKSAPMNPTPANSETLDNFNSAVWMSVTRKRKDR
ncbi:hypothetical protein FRC03_002872 [Tulasnella sp. 419]|nr:hypothetical protein FRC03_002872 [Tulasnella sp. 419]